MNPAPPLAARREKLRRLATERFDLLVVGGGINGAGIAREAALRGIRTALVDRGDFGNGTSSRSSKLIHGGLRYLETGDVRLVLEASRERDLLRRRVAPHLVEPLAFFFPVFLRGPVPAWKLRAGLWAYDALAAFRNLERHRYLRGAAAAEAEPHLRRADLLGGAVYWDCRVDDARLVLENVLSAEEAGAVCVNYVAVERFEHDGGRLAAAWLRSAEDGEGDFRIAASVVVNAAGPWLDHVRRLDEPTARPVLRPTKGVHVVVPRERVGNRHAVVMHSPRDRRLVFMIPWEAHAIVGTTDTDYAGPLDRVVACSDDVRYLLETANAHFPRAELAESDVISTYAGLRPLVAAGTAGERPSRVSREDALFESASGLVSLAGGKLTTYRRVAVKVVERVAARLREGPGGPEIEGPGGSEEPLPGARGWSGAPGDEPHGHLARRYGCRAGALAERLERHPELARPLAAGAPAAAVEARFAAELEMALRVEDVLRRRTPVALSSRDGGEAAAPAAAEEMGRALGWSAGEVGDRIEEYRRAASSEDRWRRGP